MSSDRRIPDSAESYPDDRNLLAAVLEEPADLVIWPATGLAEVGLTAGQRAVVATWRLDCEVRNGGFGQYFAALGAAASAAAGEALAGLGRLGADGQQRLLVEALALFEQGWPEDPDAAQWGPPAELPATEEPYGCGLRQLAGASGPDLESMRERAAERRRFQRELRRIFGGLDDRYLALSRDGQALERYWVAFVRAHPGEFFSR
jgi:hypothetical protein